MREDEARHEQELTFVKSLLENKQISIKKRIFASNT